MKIKHNFHCFLCFLCYSISIIKQNEMGVFMKTKSELQRLSLSYPEELKEKLEKEAQKQKRSLPALLKLILNDYLKKQKEV